MVFGTQQKLPLVKFQNYLLEKFKCILLGLFLDFVLLRYFIFESNRKIRLFFREPLFMDDGRVLNLKKSDILRSYLLPVDTKIYYKDAQGDYSPCIIKSYCYIEANKSKPGYQVQCIESSQILEVPREDTCLKSPIPIELHEEFKITLQPLTPTRSGVQLENILSSRNRTSRNSIAPGSNFSTSKGKQVTKRRRTGDYSTEDKENRTISMGQLSKSKSRSSRRSILKENTLQSVPEYE